MAIELEKKWVLKEIPDLTNHNFEFIKAEKIVQSYLSKDERLRIISKPGAKIKEYFHQIKNKIGEGQSIEESKTITEKEYLKLHKSAYKELTKVRRTYLNVADGFTYEIDHLRFVSPRVDILLMEIEFQDKYQDLLEVDTYFELPEFFDKYILADVTSYPEFSNYQLAQPIK